MNLPRSISSQGKILNITVEMHMETVKFGRDYELTTRVFDGSIPGPTIRVKPGDKFNITFLNSLTEQENVVETHNDFQLPDTANLHFHGGWMSGELPSDDVTHPVKPGESFDYIQGALFYLSLIHI